ncbi:MAG: homoserine kinase [Acidobacteriaceae bacterium]|nr:homoserine kinase [Acidobacteriaceae bacterium]
MGASRAKGSDQFRIELAATSANLGPAFDAAALAVSLFLKISASPGREFSIGARGCDSGICSDLKNHLILTTYADVLKDEEKPVIPLVLRIDNEIPIGKGCGSSAAARLAGIALANHFGRLRWATDRIVGEAAWREHHPDNAAACWMGGLAIARMSGHREARIARIRPKGRWPLLLVVPGEALPTEEARRVLPTQYSRNDVVNNIQNSMLLVAAFAQGRHDLLSAALGDRIHEPYRSELCPLLPALQPLRGTNGILGVVLSGAGPSVLVFLDPKESAKKVKKFVKEYLKNHGLHAELIPTAISNDGVRS